MDVKRSKCLAIDNSKYMSEKSSLSKCHTQGPEWIWSWALQCFLSVQKFYQCSEMNITHYWLHLWLIWRSVEQLIMKEMDAWDRAVLTYRQIRCKLNHSIFNRCDCDNIRVGTRKVDHIIRLYKTACSFCAGKWRWRLAWTFGDGLPSGLKE